MKTNAFLLLVFCLFGSRPLWAQAQANDPMADWLFPPDFVMQQEQVIKLDAEQRQFIETEIKSAQTRMHDAELLVRENADKLLALVKQERVNERQALERVDKVLDGEREMRRTQLSLLIRVKNRLTLDQQAKLQELKIGFKAIEAKSRQVQAGVERWQQEGRDPSAIIQMMQDLEPIVRDGKMKEAEALLDRALKTLNARKE